jgi:hypothetical protein
MIAHSSVAQIIIYHFAKFQPQRMNVSALTQVLIYLNNINSRNHTHMHSFLSQPQMRRPGREPNFSSPLLLTQNASPYGLSVRSHCITLQCTVVTHNKF